MERYHRSSWKSPSSPESQGILREFRRPTCTYRLPTSFRIYVPCAQAHEWPLFLSPFTLPITANAANSFIHSLKLYSRHVKLPKTQTFTLQSYVVQQLSFLSRCHNAPRRFWRCQALPTENYVARNVCNDFKSAAEVPKHAAWRWNW